MKKKPITITVESVKDASHHVGRIVDRCNVGWEFERVKEYVLSRFVKGIQFTPKAESLLDKVIQARMDRNLTEYCRVMGGYY